MLEQIKSADWKKQTVAVTTKQETEFKYEGTPCRVYLSQYAVTEQYCGGRWNLQVSVGGLSFEVRTSGLVDTAEEGMELASRVIPALHAAHIAVKSGV